MTRHYVPWWVIVPGVIEMLALLWVVFPIVGVA